jgi:hypothetical protein
MILGALSDVGGREYLAEQARSNPGPFLSLVGKVLPLQLTGDPERPIAIDFSWAPAQNVAPTIEHESPQLEVSFETKSDDK